MEVGVPKETFPGEARVALTPAAAGRLVSAGHGVRVETGAGAAAGYPDSAYSDKGVQLVDAERVWADSNAILQVRTYGTNPQAGQADLERLGATHVLIGMANPLGAPELSQAIAERGATLFALELLPRITRAQAMDVLSSMANLAGYKSVLLAADSTTKVFPMMMTAAGTISPARVLVLGVGVAGLQAIATARRLGAKVEAYDIRPEVKEQVESVGGKFVELNLEAETSGAGGYAAAQSEDFYKRQREALAEYVRVADVVITTAAVPGKRAPILLTEQMMQGMQPGAIVVDLAAETGGNCELTRPEEVVEHRGVRILGPTNVPARLAFHASQFYAKNITTFFEHVTDQDGQLSIDTSDEITAATLVARDGRLVHERVATLHKDAGDGQ